MSARGEDREMSEGSNYGSDRDVGGHGENQGGNDDRTEQDRVNDQVDALVALRDPETRRQREDWLIRRRPVTDELAPRGVRRVGVQRTPRLTSDNELADEQILTVDREIIAPTRDSVADDELRVRLDDELADFDLVEELCCGLARYRVPEGAQSVTDAVRRLRNRGVPASANHAVMLGNTSKGGNSVDGSTRVPNVVVQEVDQGDDDTYVDTPLVVVIDTGLDAGSRDRTDGFLDDVVARDEDLDPLDEVEPDGTPTSDGLLDQAAGHGTFVAGLIRQVEPRADVIMLRALDTEGMGGEDMIAMAICRAREIFRQHGGRGVLNLSLGIETIDDLPPLAIECALRELPDDVVVVAAAGNEPSRRPLWPAAHKRVVAVAGLCDNLSPSAWSNRGHVVDFSTRGEGIVSTFVVGTETQRPDEPPATEFPFGGQQHAYALWTGTSFAAPQVAARIAGMLAEDHRLPGTDAVQRLRDKGTYLPGWGYVVGILPPADPPLECSGARLG